MTDHRLTQIAIEEWALPSPPEIITQVAVEEWGSVAAATLRMVATQFAVEEWASVAVSSGVTAAQARTMVMA
jgi:hypothetical protein